MGREYRNVPRLLRTEVTTERERKRQLLFSFIKSDFNMCANPLINMLLDLVTVTDPEDCFRTPPPKKYFVSLVSPRLPDLIHDVRLDTTTDMATVTIVWSGSRQ